MSASNNSGSSFLGRLGLGGSRKSLGGEAAADGGKKPSNIFTEARRHLLEEISTFLLAHDLEVTPANLVIAHGAFSGANPGLARQFATRAHAGITITQEWLDEATANDEEEYDADGVQLLMAKLESTLVAFSKSTNVARSATAHYNDELAQHVADLEQVEETGTIISNLADLAKAMLERTRKVEQEMRRSEDEAKSLRQSLDKAKRDAEIDHLTGLPNRRAFEALLDTHYRDARLAIEPLCIAFCDIDHFKRINDTHGHDAGDRVIKTIADSLATITNDNCHVARHGGEEFVMLFRGVSLTEAHERLDALREQFASRKLVNRKTDAPFGQVTFSGGIADVFAFPNPRDALKAADEALYGAKEGGRNKILVAHA
ncbi:GGDEF domain-containing protein [Sphingobium sp. LB126]|uniref:GGDEF domain-containing protein n=1 Tax=Sphingobium sp. LB126 TaxID=1983755 RepID=UPI001F5BE35F|nr:GGDEF domain-containing protein [Sphingobium sp. LB126]